MRKIGKYEVINEIEPDSLYLAKDSQSDLEITLKVVGSYQDESDEVKEKIKQESELVLEFEHPNIVDVYDVGYEDGEFYFAMQHLTGKTLRQFLFQNEKIHFDLALTIASQIANALDYAAAEGLMCLKLGLDDIVIENVNDSPLAVISNLNFTSLDKNGRDLNPSYHLSLLTSLVFEMITGEPLSIDELSTIKHDGIQDRFKSTSTKNGIDLFIQEFVSLPLNEFLNSQELIGAFKSIEERLIRENDQVEKYKEILSIAAGVREFDDWLEVQSFAKEAAEGNKEESGDLVRLAEAAASLYRQNKTQEEFNRINKLYEEGLQDLQNEDWENALIKLQDVAKSEPDFREVQEKMIEAINELRLRSLFELALEQNRSGDMAKACQTWMILLSERWNYRNGVAVEHFVESVKQVLDGIESRMEGSYLENNLSSIWPHSPKLVPSSSSTEISFELAEAMDWLEEVLLEEIVASGDVPEDPDLADDWLDKLATKMTGRLDQAPVKDSNSRRAEGYIESAPKTGWLERLIGKMTDELDENSIKDQTETGKTSAGARIHDTDWLNELAEKVTDRLENEPNQIQGVNKENLIRMTKSTDWLERLAAKMTDKLEESHVQRQKDNGPNEKRVSSATWTDNLTEKKTDRLESKSESDGPEDESTQRSTTGNVVVGPDGKEMVCIPSGEFIYGVNRATFFLQEFWIDKTPVTNAEYKRFLDENPNHPVPYSESENLSPYNWNRNNRTYPNGKGSHPVVFVSIDDVRAYAQWAKKRLPSEQEWEKAARGIDGRTYPWGRIWNGSACNSMETGISGTTPIGKFSPAGDSPYGCIDMSGNVWEWTASEYSDSTMVVRGGSWRNSHLDVWCTMRAGNVPDTLANHIGFRLVSSSISITSSSLLITQS